jgi:hypothetical protein
VCRDKYKKKIKQDPPNSPKSIANHASCFASKPNPTTTELQTSNKTIKTNS